MGAKYHNFCLFSVSLTIILKNGAKSNHFACFQPNLLLFSADLFMEYRMFISIVDISTNLKNIAIDIVTAIIKNIAIDIDKEVLENIDIDKEVLENIYINIDIDKEILENIDIDINKEIWENIDINKEILENINKILNRLEFGISNSTTPTPLHFPDLSVFSFCKSWFVLFSVPL